MNRNLLGYTRKIEYQKIIIRKEEKEKEEINFEKKTKTSTALLEG